MLPCPLLADSIDAQWNYFLAISKYFGSFCYLLDTITVEQTVIDKNTRDAQGHLLAVTAYLGSFCYFNNISFHQEFFLWSMLLFVETD